MNVAPAAQEPWAAGAYAVASKDYCRVSLAATGKGMGSTAIPSSISCSASWGVAWPRIARSGTSPWCMRRASWAKRGLYFVGFGHELARQGRPGGRRAGTGRSTVVCPRRCARAEVQPRGAQTLFDMLVRAQRALHQAALLL